MVNSLICDDLMVILPCGDHIFLVHSECLQLKAENKVVPAEGSSVTGEEDTKDAQVQWTKDTKDI